MPDVEISDKRRRVVLDWALAAAVVACIMAFADMRATVRAQTAQFERLTTRLDAIEAREQSGASSVATKDDIRRIEARLDNLAQAIMADRTRNR